MLTKRTPEAHAVGARAVRASCAARASSCRSSVGKDTVVFPGFDGGAEWGGSAFDPETGLLYVNANEMAWTCSLAETPERHVGTAALSHATAPAAIATIVTGAPPEIPVARRSRQRKRTPPRSSSVIRQGADGCRRFPNARARHVDAIVQLRHQRRRQGAAEHSAVAHRRRVPLHRLSQVPRSGRLSRRSRRRGAR